MASPPYTATSPPYTQQTALSSKKRPSISTTDLNTAKRRKPSLASTTSGLHPLRQTSFPPPEADPNVFSPQSYGRSPSVASSMAGGDGEKTRGRKPRPDARSVTKGNPRGRPSQKAGTRANSVVTTQTTGKQRKQDDTASKADTAVEEEEEEEDDGDLGASMTVNGGEQVDEDQERKKLAILMEAFTGDQSDRYDAFRRVKLNPPTVRRLVNQVLSQSVPDAVVKTVNGYTKVFIGEMVERARGVQAEWDRAAGILTPSPTPTAPPKTEFPSQDDPSQNAVQSLHPQPTSTGTSTLPTATPTATATATTTTAVRTATATATIEPRPLQPDHMREALRRYRQDHEGGGAGMKLLSLGGMQGYPSATGGRRMFR